MSLFGNIRTKPKTAKLKLSQITDEIIKDSRVKNELATYLKSRRQQHNVPSKVSWKMQLELLCKLPVDRQLSQVDNAILRGWRAVAFKDSSTYNQGVTRTVSDSSNIVAEGF